MNFSITEAVAAIAALASGGGLTAWLSRKKPGAEIRVLISEADTLVWEKMLETVARLERDVNTNLERIEHLEAAIEACNVRERDGIKREKALAKRIVALEKAASNRP